MPVNEAIPVYEAAYTQKLTVYFTAAVTGKKFVGPLTTFQSGPLALSADPLPAGDGGNIQCAGPPAAGGPVGGVAMYDCAINTRGGVLRGAGTMLAVTSGAAVSAGNELQVDATGAVIPYSSGRKVGIAHSTVGGAGLDVVVELYATPAA
jgi:hypothetical protein